MRTLLLLGCLLCIDNCYGQSKSVDSVETYQSLKRQLVTIYQDDQRQRQQIDAISQKFGANSKQVDSLWKIIQRVDQLNLEKVKGILSRYGWVGEDKVGVQASMAQFLVIQHADLATQHLYLPLMREAVKHHKADAGSLALLEDRVALGERRMQVYGSQIGQDANGAYVMPLIDPDNVDKRRAAVGLGPLATYVSHWGIHWDVAAYKTQLPVLKQRHGIQ